MAFEIWKDKQQEPKKAWVFKMEEDIDGPMILAVDKHSGEHVAYIVRFDNNTGDLVLSRSIHRAFAENGYDAQGLSLSDKGHVKTRKG